MRQAADEWLADAERGVITNRSGDRYKPSAIRAYGQSLRLRVLARARRSRSSAQITRGDLQRLADQLVAERTRAVDGAVLAAAAARDVQARDLARRADRQPDRPA